MPARESQLREAPYPKSKNMEKKKDDVYIEVEDKDPVWLKDKGDHFFKRADYTGAVHAYTKAIAADPEFLMGRLNRATTYIKIRAYDHAVADCSDIIMQIQNMKEQDLDLDRMFYTKIMARAHVKRAAALVWASKLEASLLDFDTLLNNPEYCRILGDRDCATLHKDKARVQIRMRSNEIKAEGDKCFYHEDLESANNKYKEALKADQENEYALANISVIHLKRLEYAESIDYAGQAL